MKIRMGFVSNSSSSSFIVGLDKLLYTKEEIHQLLFGFNENFSIPDIYTDTISFKTYNVAESLINQINNAKVLKNEEEIIEEISKGYFLEYPEYSYGEKPSNTIEQECRDKFSCHPSDLYENIEKEKKNLFNRWRKQLNKECEELNREIKEAAKSYWAQQRHLFKNKQHVVVFSYSDEDGSFNSYMEHSGIVNKLGSVLTISHH